MIILMLPESEVYRWGQLILIPYNLLISHSCLTRLSADESSIQQTQISVLDSVEEEKIFSSWRPVNETGQDINKRPHKSLFACASHLYIGILRDDNSTGWLECGFIH